MGLFDGATRTQVGTSVSRVVPDDKILPSTQKALMRTLFTENASYFEEILEDLTTGLGTTAERMYKYAEKYHPYGLPTAKIITSSSGENAVRNVINQITVETGDIDYIHVGRPNFLHWAWGYLVNTWGYESSTNKLTVLRSQAKTDVFLKDIQIVVKSDTLAHEAQGCLDLWGAGATSGATHNRVAAPMLPTPIVVDDTIATDQAWFTVTWKDPLPATTNNDTELKFRTTKELVYKVNIPATLKRDKDYAHAKYAYNGKNLYFMYEIGSGTYTDLDNYYTPTFNDLGSFFPLIYLRYNKAPVSTVSSDIGFKHQNRMLELMHIDYLDLLTEVNKNSNINDVQQGFLMFGIPANSDKQEDIQYLFDFFSKVYTELATGVGIGEDLGDFADFTHARTGSVTTAQEAAIARAMRLDVPKISMTIRDSRFTMGLTMQSVSKRYVTYELGDKEDYKRVITTRDVPYTYKKAGVKYTFNLPAKVHIYYKKLSPSVCIEIAVYDLKMTYYIYDVNTTIAAGDNPNLLVPIDYSITKDYTKGVKEGLYSRSLHAVFNSRIDTHVEWYQTADFINALVVVATVMSIYDMGTSLAKVWSTKTATELAILAATKVFTAYAYAAGFKIFAKAVGIETARILAIAAMFYAAKEIIQAGSFKNAPLAQDLLKLSNGLNSGVTAALKDEMDLLRKDYESFSAYAKKESEHIEKLLAELDQSPRLDPMVFFDKSVEDYYNRTVHYGNIGTIGIDSVSSYVEVALTLPSVNDTLGSESNV